MQSQQALGAEREEEDIQCARAMIHINFYSAASNATNYKAVIAVL